MQPQQPPKQMLNQALQYDPQSPIKSDEGQAPNYNEQYNYIVSQHSEVSNIILQQQFVSQFDTQLQNVLDQSNYQNFVQFIKKLIKIAAEARNKNNKQLITVLIREAAKVIYCAYNNQFQQLATMVPAQKSIIYYLLSLLLKQWHQVTHRTQFIKALVKKLCELFPTAQVAFWYYFIVQVQIDAVNSRKFKVWPIPKEKSQFVIPAVQALTQKIDHNFRRRYERYSNIR